MACFIHTSQQKKVVWESHAHVSSSLLLTLLKYTETPLFLVVASFKPEAFKNLVFWCFLLFTDQRRELDQHSDNLRACLHGG